MDLNIPFPSLDKLAAAEAVNQLNREFFPGMLGVKFLEVAPELTVAVMQARPELRQPVGVLHGGALTTLADTACAVAALVNLPDPMTQHILTSELKIHFLGNVGEGQVRAEAKPVQVGKRLMVIECRIFSESQKLLCLMTCTQIIGKYIK